MSSEMPELAVATSAQSIPAAAFGSVTAPEPLPGPGRQAAGEDVSAALPGSHAEPRQETASHRPPLNGHVRTVPTLREQLASLLRQSRLDAGYESHGALAKKLNVSRPVVSKAENPAQPVPSDAVLAAWAGATGAALDTLTDLAQRAKSGTPDWFMPYRQAEAQASILRCWSPLLVPGVLQTESYMRAVLSVEPYTVEVADHADCVLVRDTKKRAGPVLRFSPAAWRRFADQVKRSLLHVVATAGLLVSAVTVRDVRAGRSKLSVRALTAMSG
jgi:transcriptional regulator with XRE-family HTH domain